MFSRTHIWRNRDFVCGSHLKNCQSLPCTGVIIIIFKFWKHATQTFPVFLRNANEREIVRETTTTTQRPFHSNRISNAKEKRREENRCQSKTNYFFAYTLDGMDEQIKKIKNGFFSKITLPTSLLPHAEAAKPSILYSPHFLPSFLPPPFFRPDNWKKE